MKQVRVGIVGLGGIGNVHLRYLGSVENAVLKAVCDVDPKRVETVAARYGVRGFHGYREMLDSGEVDAILIATPHYQHPEITLAAFERGLHVLCEKPLAVGVKAARHVVDVHARRYPQLKFAVMFQMRTSPLYQALRRLVADGELGEITRVTWLITDWFRTWHYYASGGWRATWAGEGGGVLINQCPHNLDLLQWIVGMPARVSGLAFLAKRHPIEVEDEVSTILEYANGAIGHFITTTGEAPGVNRLEIAGDRGRIVAEGGELVFHRTARNVREVLEKAPEMFPRVETWDCRIPLPSQPEGHQVITQNFVNAILNDEPLIGPGAEGVKGLELGNAMLMAGVTRQPVDLPLDGDAYDAFLAEMTRQHGGKKQLRGAVQ